MKLVLFASFFIFIVVPHCYAEAELTCDDLNCDICCRPSSPPVCVDDTEALDCEMRRDSQLDQLGLLLATIFGFLLGMIIKLLI